MRYLVPLCLTLFACQEYEISDKPELVDDPVLVDTDTDEPPAAPLDPDIHVDPLVLQFPPLPPGCVAPPQLVTVSNVGEGPLDILNLEMTGPDGDDFLFEPGGVAPFRLRPGNSFQMEVAFTPSSARLYDRLRVLVESTDPDEAQVRVEIRGEGYEGSDRVDRYVQHQGNTVVDVLFVVDNSGSMADNLTAFGAAMDVFIDEFLQLGLDFHLGVTTMDMTSAGPRGELVGPVISAATPDPVQAFRGQIATAIAAPGSSSEVGYAASRAALTPPRTNSAPNNQFLRAQANLAVVVVSDEDEGDANPEGFAAVGRNNVTDDYVFWLQAMKPTIDAVSFSGLVGPRTGGIAACGLLSNTSATRAPQYNRAIRATGGVWSNICLFDVDPFLNHLAYVARGLDTQFGLSATPAGTGCNDITVTVAGQPVPCNNAVNGWTYDPATNEITINGAAVPEPGEEVVIAYPVSEACP